MLSYSPHQHGERELVSRKDKQTDETANKLGQIPVTSRVNAINVGLPHSLMYNYYKCRDIEKRKITQGCVLFQPKVEFYSNFDKGFSKQQGAESTTQSNDIEHVSHLFSRNKWAISLQNCAQFHMWQFSRGSS